MLYKRGGVWWMEFCFRGQRIRESTGSSNIREARDIENERRRALRLSVAGVTRPRTPELFSTAAENWLRIKAVHLAARSIIIERANLKHLKPFFGKRLLIQITPEAVSRYQATRLAEGAAPKTINLEVGTLRALLRQHRLWVAIQPDVKMLHVDEDKGRALTLEEETRLLEACRNSRSRSLYTGVALALNTAMRAGELRLLRWRQVNVAAATLTVGKSKTAAGTGRLIPLNQRAAVVLSFWASLFPDREPAHFVFPAERYGHKGKKDGIYNADPTRPLGRWKVAWKTAKKSAQVNCRFHDLRHTACTRMLEAGVPFSAVALIMGWSASATVRMARRYGHVGLESLRQAVAALEKPAVPPTISPTGALATH